MATFVPICAVGDLAPGTGKTVTVEGKELAVFNVDGTYHVIDNECPHRGGPVCQGGLFGQVIEPIAEDGTVRLLEYQPDRLNIVCPWHGYEYDVRTGINVGNRALRLRKVDVRVADGKVYVRP